MKFLEVKKGNGVTLTERSLIMGLSNNTSGYKGITLLQFIEECILNKRIRINYFGNTPFISVEKGAKAVIDEEKKSMKAGGTLIKWLSEQNLFTSNFYESPLTTNPTDYRITRSTAPFQTPPVPHQKLDSLDLPDQVKELIQKIRSGQHPNELREVGPFTSPSSLTLSSFSCLGFDQIVRAISGPF